MTKQKNAFELNFCCPLLTDFSRLAALKKSFDPQYAFCKYGMFHTKELCVKEQDPFCSFGNDLFFKLELVIYFVVFSYENNQRFRK